MATERRSTAWLWILVPIFSLLVFFCLRSCKEPADAHQIDTVVGL